jgi:hypothetical protein
VDFFSLLPGERKTRGEWAQGEISGNGVETFFWCLLYARYLLELERQK